MFQKFASESNFSVHSMPPPELPSIEETNVPFEEAQNNLIEKNGAPYKFPILTEDNLSHYVVN